MKSQFKKLASVLVCLCLIFSVMVITSATETSATISFADLANRVSAGETQQVWSQNGITVTNDKGDSTSPVNPQYYNPVRFYKNSDVTIEFPQMTKIEIDCTGVPAKNTDAWVNSCNDANATASKSDSTVTIAFTNPVDSFKIKLTDNQARAMAMTVYAAAAEEPKPEEPTDVVVEGGIYPAMMQGNIYKDGNTGNLVVQTNNAERICTVNTYNVADYESIVIAAGFRANIVFLTAEGEFASNHAWKTGTVAIASLAGDAPTFRVVISADPNANPFTTDMFPAEGLKLVTKVAEEPTPEKPAGEIVFAQGNVKTAEGKLVLDASQPHRITTSKLLALADYEKIELATGYKAWLYAYKADGSLVNTSGSGKWIEETTYALSELASADAVFFSVTVAKKDNANLTPADLPADAIVFTKVSDTEPEVPENKDPAADSTLTVSEAIALGTSKEHNVYTEGKYYVQGEITEVYNTTYGNMKIKDDAGNILTVYGTYSADGSTRYDKMETKPVAGDTVKVYGIIGQYNGTPQMKNAWIIEHIPAEKPVEPEVPENNDPAADSTLTVSEAIALGTSKEHNVYTAGKYYVAGEITEVYNTTYGNMKIKDDAGNILTVYGTYSADGSTRYDKMETKPVAGDTVKVYGIIGQYNGTPQMKNAWIVEHTPATKPEEPEKTITVSPDMEQGTIDGNAGEIKPGVDTRLYNYGLLPLEGLKKVTVGATYKAYYHFYDADGKWIGSSGAWKYGDSTIEDLLTMSPNAAQFKVVAGLDSNAALTPADFPAEALVLTAVEGYTVPRMPVVPDEPVLPDEPIVPDEPEVPENKDPAADSELTIKEAIALGETKEKNNYTEGKYYVTGVIKEVYNPQYGNMYLVDEEGNELTIYGSYNADGTVSYKDMDVKPIAGDTIKVYGIIGKYNAPQMKNAWIVEHVAGEGEAPEAPEKAEDIMADAEALQPGSTLPYEATLTGTITSIDTEYSEQYGNVTVTIEVDGTDGKTIQCFRLKGEGAEALAVGDEITVTGYIINYNGKLQFNSGSTFVAAPDDDNNEPSLPVDPDDEEDEDNVDGDIADEEIEEDKDETSPETSDAITAFAITAMILAATLIAAAYIFSTKKVRE